jgi:putative flippase GtrA
MVSRRGFDDGPWSLRPIEGLEARRKGDRWHGPARRRWIVRPRQLSYGRFYPCSGFGIYEHPVKISFRRLVRYAAVSVVSTAVSLSILGILIATRVISAAWANIVATSVATVPSFELNRRWVWKKGGQRSLFAEVGPFCAMSFAGLALSTLAVSVAARWANGDGFGTTGRTVVAEGANIATFGTLWLAQFAILDRVLFKTSQPAIPITGQF